MGTPADEANGTATDGRHTAEHTATAGPNDMAEASAQSRQNQMDDLSIDKIKGIPNISMIMND